LLAAIPPVRIFHAGPKRNSGIEIEPALHGTGFGTQQKVILPQRVRWDGSPESFRRLRRAVPRENLSIHTVAQ
jgi:hypothetical protein